MFPSTVLKLIARLGGALFFVGAACVPTVAKAADAPLVSPNLPVLQKPPQRDLVLQRGHSSTVVALAKGPQDVIVSADYEDIIVWRANGMEMLWSRPLPNLGIVVLRVADGKTILVGGAKKVLAFDLWSGDLVGDLDLPEAGRWQPGGRELLSAVSKSTLELVSWDAKTASLQRRSVPLSAAMIAAVAKPTNLRGAGSHLRDGGQNVGAVVSPDEKSVALWGDNLLFMAPLDLSSERTLEAAPKPAVADFRRAVWSPDSSQIALSLYIKVPEGKAQTLLQLVEVESLKTLWSVPASISKMVSWKPDGTQLYAEAVYDARDGSQLSKEKYGIGLWSDDGTKIINSGESNKNSVYESDVPAIPTAAEAGGKKAPKTGGDFYLKSLASSRGRSYPPYAANWSPDGKRVFLQNNLRGDWGPMSVWSWPDLTPITTLSSDGIGDVQMFRWSQNGEKIVFAGEYGVRSLEAATGEQLAEDKSMAGRGRASEFQITPDGSAYFRYTEFDNESHTGGLGGKFPALPPHTRIVAFTPQGEMRAFFYREGERIEDENGNRRWPRSWFLKSGEREIALTDEVYGALGFSGDASTLWVSAGKGNKGRTKLRSLDTATGEVLATIEWPELESGRYLQDNWLAIAPGAARFTFTGEQEVRIYDDKLQFVSLPIRGAQRTQLSPDGKFAIASVGDFFEVWDVAQKRRLSQLAILGFAKINPADKEWALQWIKLNEAGVQMSGQALDWLRWREGNQLKPVEIGDFKPVP